MLSNKRFVLTVLGTVLLINHSLAQLNVNVETIPKRKHALVLLVGGGWSTYAAPVKLRSSGIAESVTKSSLAGTIRLMWYPNHRLRVGLESGFTNFYSYRISNRGTPGKVSLEAIPVLVVWSMQIIKRLNIHAGFGSYFLTTRLDYQGKVQSSDAVLGSALALSYTQPLSKTVGIALEGKWMNAFETRDEAITLQLHLVWKLLQWQR